MSNPNDNFQHGLKNIRSEADLQAFIQRNSSHPAIQKALSMTQGKSPSEIMGIVNNLAAAQKVNVCDVKNHFGFK